MTLYDFEPPLHATCRKVVFFRCQLRRIYSSKKQQKCITGNLFSGNIPLWGHSRGFSRQRALSECGIGSNVHALCSLCSQRQRSFSFIPTARLSYGSTVFGVVILSVRLSFTCVLCDKTKQCTADILIPHERAITLVFRHQQWLVGDAPSV